MAVATTSKKAYRELKDLGEKQRKVFDALGELGVASNQDIADYLGWPINTVTPRILELRNYKFVTLNGMKQSKQGTTVKTWCCSNPNDKQLHKAAVRWMDDDE